MKNVKTAIGTCLCGAVTLSFDLTTEIFDACHCGMCRTWSGGPALTVDGGSDVAFKGEGFITTYDSSAWAERGFCKSCGTHLFYRFKHSKHYNFPLGLLKNVEHLQFKMQIFIDRKPEQYSFANKTEQMTEAEVFAKHEPKN